MTLAAADWRVNAPALHLPPARGTIARTLASQAFSVAFAAQMRNAAAEAQVASSRERLIAAAGSPAAVIFVAYCNDERFENVQIRD
jgi:hypothetical protein